jgi:hypothetical protein
MDQIIDLVARSGHSILFDVSTESSRTPEPIQRSSPRSSIHSLPFGPVFDTHAAKALLPQRFKSLADRWERETRNLSSIDQIVLHDAYQAIIGMGAAVTPLILERLRRKAGMWFPALRSITGVDPVSYEQRGDITAMRRAWLEWGRRNANC